MKVVIAFLLGAVLATLIWRPWSRVDLAMTEESASTHGAPLVLRDPESSLPGARAPITSSSIEASAAEDVTDSVEQANKFDDEFYRNLKGVERDQFLAEHRWEYIKTHRDSIVRCLAKLEAEKDPYEQHYVGAALTRASISTILDLQNRSRAWEPGVKEFLDTGKDGWYSYLSSNWVYRVNEAEFPEVAYFLNGPPFDVDLETGEKTYQPMTPSMLTMLHQLAARAIEFYDVSAPTGKD